MHKTHTTADCSAAVAAAGLPPDGSGWITVEACAKGAESRLTSITTEAKPMVMGGRRTTVWCWRSDDGVYSVTDARSGTTVYRSLSQKAARRVLGAINRMRRAEWEADLERAELERLAGVSLAKLLREVAAPGA